MTLAPGDTPHSEQLLQDRVDALEEMLSRLEKELNFAVLRVLTVLLDRLEVTPPEAGDDSIGIKCNFGKMTFRGDFFIPAEMVAYSDRAHDFLGFIWKKFFNDFREEAYDERHDS